MKFKKEDFTYGFEIEWGDIDRNVHVPEHLGTWEFCECDIVNLHKPYAGLACDPIGMNPPVGGEINTKPTRTVTEQVERIMEIKSLFPNPTDSCVNHGHVHVRVPGLRDDIDALKELVKYIQENQEITINATYFREEHKDTYPNEVRDFKGDPNKAYFKYDGGKSIPDWLCDNLQEAKDFDDFIRIMQCGKDGVSRGRPMRYGINIYNLKHTDTIEFRCFRSSVREEEIKDSLLFAREFINAALNKPERHVHEILSTHPLRKHYNFPLFQYNLEHSKAWKATKYKGDASRKERRLYEVV